MGAEMARVLVRLIDGETVQPSTILPTSLVIRESA
jgi:DNA-binding LacI/PurR family transcriptional regulator